MDAARSDRIWGGGEGKGPRQLTLYDPDAVDSGASVHRCSTPVYAPGDGGAAIDWEEVVASERTAAVLPVEERQVFRESTTLRTFYQHPDYGLAAVHRGKIAAGSMAPNTAAKFRQALNRWERYSPRPAGWSTDRPWQGRPLAWITDQHCTDAVGAMRESMASTTVRSTWSTLRTIFRRAVEVCAIDAAPEPEWPRRDQQDRAPKVLYTDEQLVGVYRACAAAIDLQVAFVCAVNVGARAVDLFSLRWEDFALTADRPVVEFVARKTGKRQCVPLADVTVGQLLRWRRASGVLCDAGCVWPKLTDPDSADPERSRRARRRNARFKRILASVGIEHSEPWQVARLTCNERLEAHMPGAGQFVLGHANTLNSISYREPSGLVYRAVTTLPQPECFGEG